MKDRPKRMTCGDMSSGEHHRMEYKTTDRLNKDVIDSILEIKDKEGLTAEAIVEEARKKRSPLHNFFDWDDSVAAHKWRLQQARVLINEVKVVVENEEYFAFENVSVIVSTNENEQETAKLYLTRNEILSNKDLREQMLGRAWNALEYWRSQYGNYEVFSPVTRAIDKVKEGFKSK